MDFAIIHTRTHNCLLPVQREGAFESTFKGVLQTERCARNPPTPWSKRHKTHGRKG